MSHDNDHVRNGPTQLDLVTDESDDSLIEEEPLKNPESGPCNNPERRQKDCPIPGCKARSLKRLADHLRCTHHIDNWLTRSNLLKMV